MEEVRKKILILGSTGMLGHMVFHFFDKSGNYDLSDITFRKKLRDESIVCDITDTGKLRETIARLNPDYIINCVGILIKGSSSNPANAIFINSYFPHQLAKLGDEVGAKVIHFSTDCVFSGKKGSYEESEFRDADDVYGRSKALGEIMSDGHLTLRTSIIGPEIKSVGEGLFHWFMNQSGQINGFTQAFWGGVTTLQLAKNTVDAIQNDLKGLMHVTNGERISKFDLVTILKDVWTRESLTIAPFEGKVVDKSLAKSVSFDFDVPGYRQMLEEQKVWMEEHGALYSEIYS